MRNIALLIVICLISSSCTRKVACVNPGVGLYFQGFDSTELSPIYITTYDKGSDFTTLQDSFVSGCFVKQGGGNIIPFDQLNRLLLKDFDVKITVPLTGSTFRMHDVRLNNNTQNVCILCMIRENCSNTITYYLNDTLYSHTPLPSDGNGVGTVFISLKK